MIERGKESSIRVLVVDDSTVNRRAIVDRLEAAGGFDVIGQAGDGDAALTMTLRLKPDAITLDLEMPGMDGFTFLRILMKRRPTPVIVISSHSRKHNVFQALELGALDFVAKASLNERFGGQSGWDELVSKLRLVRMLEVRRIQEVAKRGADESQSGSTTVFGSQRDSLGVVVIGSSTGGPSSLQTLFDGLPTGLPLSYLVAQHMPAKFTSAFADRLNRHLELNVCEAKGGELLEADRVFIAPGGKNLRVVRGKNGLMTEVLPAKESMKYVPSVDLLFSSAAKVVGANVLALVLTGMGDDGRHGLGAVNAAGGRAIAESEETAVIFGMPQEAIKTGFIDKICRLDELAAEIRKFGEQLE